MKRLSTASDSVKYTISTLVPITTTEKRKVPKTLIQGISSGTNENQLNYIIVGLPDYESRTKGLSNTAKEHSSRDPPTHPLYMPSPIRNGEGPYWGTNEENANETCSYLDHEKEVGNRSQDIGGMSEMIEEQA
ncbi:hypothetical protein ACH5RR_023028 [Cinchona calisaya]|uniref:Uncharacterized protein n=1 Tax=Cinchona calisaya TaxID=153742 RepID=A0ABD2Z9G5_9GENT